MDQNPFRLFFSSVLLVLFAAFHSENLSAQGAKGKRHLAAAGTPTARKTLPPNAPDSVKLYRYAKVQPYLEEQKFYTDSSMPGYIFWATLGQYTYMDVEDTVLDEENPEACFGSAEKLKLDPRQRDRVLIAFRSLNRAIASLSEITEAALALPVDGPIDPDATLEVRKVLVRWRDGGADGQPLRWAPDFNHRFHAEGEKALSWSVLGARPAQLSLKVEVGDVFRAERSVLVLKGEAITQNLRRALGT